MKKTCFPLFLFIICLQGLSGQTYRQYMKAAEEEFDGKNFFAAMKHYQEAMSIEGEKPEVLFKYAEAARLFASYTFADTAYTKVLNSEKKEAYPLARYWLATVKKKQGKYEEAQGLFQQFVNEKPKGVEATYFANAQAEIEALDWAIEAINQPDENVTVEQLSDKINSPYSEFGPTQWRDELYFSTENFQKIIKKGYPPRQYSQVMRAKNEGRKVDPAAFNDENRQTAHTAFNRNNARLYYTLCDYVGETAIIRCDLYYRIIDANGKFGEPVRLPDNINVAGYTATQPNIGYMEENRKEWLFFVSDRPGGKGGLDIWAVEISEAGSFSPPFNVADINTAGDDVTPFFHTLARTLYFSSDSRQGFGGFDIYNTARVGGAWGEVERLPSPYNSSYGDTHFWMNAEQTKGYFASSRLGSHVLEPEFEACCNDIYTFTLQVLDLDILTFNKRDERPLNGVTLNLIELSKNGNLNLATTTNPESNDFNFKLKKGTKYALLATKNGFLPVRDTIDLTRPGNLQERGIHRKYYLVPETVELNVASFNKRTMNPLKEVEVRLAVDGQEVDFKKNDQSNTVQFTLDRGKLYELIGSKVAYFSDTARIDLRMDLTTSIIHQNLLLRPKEIEDFPPLVIYFDNDFPNPRTRKTTTEFSYEETWDAYMAKKDLFRDEYVKSLVGQDSFLASRRIEAFFDREVKNGFLSLKVFTEDVYHILGSDDFKVELVIQGFTSPRASEDYNFNLSQRRSDCLKNHFETWNGGVLMPYIQKGLLTMQVVGYGEKLAPQYISDRLDDERESIYSVVASFERKVAIIGARRVADR